MRQSNVYLQSLKIRYYLINKWFRFFLFPKKSKKNDLGNYFQKVSLWFFFSVL